MPFYKDYDKKSERRADKRVKAQSKGGFEDEGSRYSGARGGQKPENRQGGYRFTKAAPQAYSERGQGTTPRPYGERRSEQRADAPRVQYGRPARPDARPPRDNDRPRYDERPQQSGDRPRFNARPPRPYGGPTPRPVPRPASPDRPRNDANSYRYAPPATYEAPQLGAEEAVPAENLLSGRNPIREALKSGRDIEKLLVQRGELSGSAREIVQMAREQHVPVQEVDKARLDAITQHHQGMLAFASAYQYHTVDDMLQLAKEKAEDPFLVLLDGVTDPHNLGAIIRTAECAGAHGVIVQERRAVGLTPAAVKASAGAIEHIMVARVTNLTSLIERLQKQNIWVFAADMEGEDYRTVDFSGGLMLVVGGEDSGVGRLVLEKCDRRVKLPQKGQMGSLNASVAAGILIYAAMEKR